MSLAKRKDILRTLLVIQSFVEFVRPQDILPVFGVLRPGLFVLVATILISLPIYRKIINSHSVLKLSFVFLGIVAISIFWSVNTRHAYNNAFGLFLLLFGFVLPFVFSFDSIVEIKKFIRRFVFFMFLSSLFVITHGGKGPGGPIGDENDAGLALSMAIPLCGYFLLSQKEVSKKIFFMIILLLLILGVISTASRGGLLSLIAALVGIVFISDSRFKILTIVFLIVLTVLPFVPSSYYSDMETISDTKDETRKDRILGWEKSLRMFYDNKWFGVGAGNWGWVIGQYETYADLLKQRSHASRAAHSIYFTVFPELGLIGGAVYFSIIINMLLMYFHKFNDFSAEILKNSIIISVGVFLVGGVFLSVLYYPFLWYMLAMLVALDRVQAKSLES